MPATSAPTRAGRLKLRVKAAVKIEAAEGAAGVVRVLGLKDRYARDRILRSIPVKLFVDGVIGTGTAALLGADVGSNERR